MKTLKETGTCDNCGDSMSIPPGVIYRGMRLHSYCAKRLAKQDVSSEVVGPQMDNLKRSYDEALDVDTGD